MLSNDFKKRVCGVIPALFLTSTPLSAALVGLWEFEDAADLGKATIGNDLTLNNASSSIAATSGISTGDGAANVGSGGSFTLSPDMPPNGSSTANQVNEYTIIYDIFLPTATDATWRSLLQTTTSTGRNDADYFISFANTIGVTDIGYSTGTVAADSWYRIVFSADLGDTTFGGGSMQTVVINPDGSERFTFNHAFQGLDGRHSLYSSTSFNIVHFFADDNGEDNLVAVTQLALYDQPLSRSEALDLGAPGTPIPEPSAALLGLLGSAPLLRRRRNG